MVCKKRNPDPKLWVEMINGIILAYEHGTSVYGNNCELL